MGRSRTNGVDGLGGLFLGAALATTFDTIAPGLDPATAFPAIAGLAAAGFALGYSLGPHPLMRAVPFAAAALCALSEPGWLGLAALLACAIAVGTSPGQSGRSAALGLLTGLGFGVFVWSARTTVSQQAALLVVLGLLYAAAAGASIPAKATTAPRPQAARDAIVFGALLFATSAVFDACVGAFAPTWWACSAIAILAASLAPSPSPVLVTCTAILAALTVPTPFGLPLYALALAVCGRFLVRGLRPLELAVGVAVAALAALALAHLDSIVEPSLAFGAVVLLTRPKTTVAVAVGALAVFIALLGTPNPLSRDRADLPETTFDPADSMYPEAGLPHHHLDARAPLVAERLATAFPATLTAAVVLPAYAPFIATVAQRQGLYTLRAPSRAGELLVFTPHPSALAHQGFELVEPGPRPSPLAIWRAALVSQVSVGLEGR